MIYNTLVFSDALADVQRILDIEDIDEVCDHFEKISTNPDMCLATFMLLYMKIKNVDISDLTGAELANSQPSIQNLILPPGIRL